MSSVNSENVKEGGHVSIACGGASCNGMINNDSVDDVRELNGKGNRRIKRRRRRRRGSGRGEEDDGK